MVRAVLEGVAFNLKLILDAFLEQGIEIQVMRLIGGGARSALWRQILSDVYNLPILQPSLLAEATSLGAAVAGGVGVGIFPDYSVAYDLVKLAQGERPDPSRVGRYSDLCGLFRRTYAVMEPIFESLDPGIR
jgi:xylulokinase